MAVDRDGGEAGQGMCFVFIVASIPTVRSEGWGGGGINKNK